jgi:hypothetical protein
VQVSQIFPYINKDGRLTSYDTNTIKIYYYKNMTLEQTSYNSLHYSENNTLLNAEVINEYYVYHTGDKTGLYYDSAHKVFARKVALDTSLYKSWHYRFNANTMFQRFENKLLFKKKDTINNSIEEGYGLKITPESDYGDTCYLTYSAALNTVPYTFSKEMDSMTGMKLIKMKTTNYPNKYNKFIRDYVEQNYWMNFVPVYQ